MSPSFGSSNTYHVSPGIATVFSIVVVLPALHIDGVVEADLSVGFLHLVHREGAELTAVDLIGTEVRRDGVAHHVQLHRPLEQQRAEPVIVVVQDSRDEAGEHLAHVAGGVVALQVPEVEIQSLDHELAAALAVVPFQPAIHVLDLAGRQPNRRSFFVFVYHLISFPAASPEMPVFAGFMASGGAANPDFW